MWRSPRVLPGDLAFETSRGDRGVVRAWKGPFWDPEICVLEERMTELGDLSNDELIARLRAHVGRGNEWLVGLLSYLAEVDARRLHAEHACSSMWDFCVRRLGMSEGEANRRIAAARVLRQFPLARGYLERGAIHLCAVYEMHKHLTEDNHEELLREASGKSTKAVAEMIAARFPKPDVFPCIEPVSPQLELAVATTEMAPSGTPTSLAPPPTPPVVRPRVEPLSATRYRVELTVSAETKAKLERIKDLMCHRNPPGDLEKIFDASIELLLVKLEKERLGKTSRPKATKDLPTEEQQDPALDAQRDGHPRGASNPAPAEETNEAPQPMRRKISRPVRREVFARDGAQCTYVDAEGNRCAARGYLELDHVHAKALGGSDEATNLRVRCRAHNHWHAEQVFGRKYIEERIHVRHRTCARPSAPSADPSAATSSFEVVARGLRSLGFREAEVRAAMARLQTMLDPALPTETILREALRLLT